MHSAFSLVITILVSQLRWGLVEVAAIPGCDRSAAIACGDAAVSISPDAGCNGDVLVPWLEECVKNATVSCSKAEQMDVWESYRTGFDTYLRGPECNTACVDQQELLQALSACSNRSGGLTSLALRVISDNAQPTDNICDVQLRQTKLCVDGVSGGCEVVESQAFTLLYTHREAFRRCDIPLPDDRQPVFIEDLLTALDSNPGRLPTPAPPGKPSNNQQSMEVDDTTQVVLYSVIGLCCLIIIGAGVTALVIYTNNRKEKQLKREVDKFRERNNYTTFETRRYDKYPHRREVDEEGDTDFDDAASGVSVGPYKPSGRWWTRPEFGMAASSGPIDRQFRPWAGFRNNNF